MCISTLALLEMVWLYSHDLLNIIPTHNLPKSNATHPLWGSLALSSTCQVCIAPWLATSQPNIPFLEGRTITFVVLEFVSDFFLEFFPKLLVKFLPVKFLLVEFIRKLIAWMSRYLCRGEN
jgi:hypothetical protein